MQFSQRNDDSLQAAIRELVEAAGMSMVEYVLSRHRGSVQLRLSVYRKGAIGLDDCSRIHRAIQPRVELAFPEQEVFLEVASPGVDRQIRDASEFPLYIGRGVRCYSIETSDWVSGIVERADSEKVVLNSVQGEVVLLYSSIAKARLDYSLEVGKK